MKKIDEFLAGVHRAAIAGHVHPDGDCVGSVMGTWLYLRDNFPEIQADVYLEQPSSKFGFIEGFDRIHTEVREDDYDLLILLDISSRDRIGVAGELVEKAGKTLCFDHHKTNTDSYTWKFNIPEASSASEVVFDFMDPEKISEKCAEALYMGMAHDTGIFQYSCTSPKTMRSAALLMEKGIPFSRIVDNTFYQKTEVQNRILGEVLSNMQTMFDGKLIIGIAAYENLERLGCSAADTDGIVSQLRNTKDAEAALFLYEKEPGCFKASLRSKEYADVSKVASDFGGGGHVRAAGCTVNGTAEEVLKRLTERIGQEL
ncbi:MAG: bifunctional oligoribonuclease/PAP phosphatase NrnA [Eubacteriales bacterium]|nr:bifunctional oligoribonuclease/PAP phosphatase NrnA [Eubacteriales bacterium]